MIQETKNILEIADTGFFQAHIQTNLTNYSGQNLILPDHPNCGKRFINISDNTNIYNERLTEIVKSMTSSLSMIVDFVKGFHNISH